MRHPPIRPVLACALLLLAPISPAAATEGPASPTPLIMSWVNRLIYWPLPIWVFAAFYLAVFGYAVALLWLVPPTRSRSVTRP